MRAIHVGASVAQEAKWYGEQNFQKVLWIEGDGSQEDALRQALWTFKKQEYQIAVISDHVGFCNFNIANNRLSSSILPLKLHKKYYPDVEYVDSFTVPCTTLDQIVKGQTFHFLNLDLQGAELLALQGAETLLRDLSYIYMEVNVGELYEGCALLPEVDEYLGYFDFTRRKTKINDKEWGEAFYERKG